MELMMLITADQASVDAATKKLNILGAFGQINIGKFPARYRRMALVIGIRAELQDHHDQRTLAVEMTDADNNKLFHISGPVRFPMTGTGRPGHINAVLELNDLPFPNPGEYVFTVYMDKEQIGRTTIDVVQRPQPPE